MENPRYPTTEITEERYKAIRGKAFEIAKSYGMLDHAEDFAQEAAFQYSKGRKAVMSLMFIDYIRKAFGDTRTESNKELNQSRLGESRYFEEVDPNVHGYEPEMSSDIRHCQNNLTDQDRVIFTLLCKYGLSMAEIGDVLGVSESRICQHMGEIKKKLVKRIKKDN